MKTRLMIAVLGLCGLLFGAGCYQTADVDGGFYNPPVERHYARKAIEVGNYAEADQRLARVLRNDPQDWEAHYFQGLSYLGQDRAVEAQTQLEQALAANDRGSDTPEILDALAESMFQQRNYEALYSFLDAQISRYEGWQDYARKARLLAMAADIDGAALAFRQAAYFSRNETEDIYIEIADFYIGLGDQDKALQALKWAYYINPENPGTATRFSTLGYVPGPTLAEQPPQPEYAGAEIFRLPNLIGN